MYPENLQELLAAARELLSVIKNIPQTSINDITLAWDRLDKAVKTFDAMEKPLESEVEK